MTRNFRYFLSFTFIFFLILIPLLPVLFSEEEQPEEASGEFRAVLIGIDKYQSWPGDKEYANLNYCVKDIEAIADILKQNGYKDENITVVKEVKADGESFPATKSRIEGKIKEVIARCNKHDVILVYFSGHGIRLEDGEGRIQNYLVPYDGKYIPGKGSVEELTREELTSRKETLLTVSSIDDLLKNNCHARTKYFIMDACQKDVLANVERGEAKVKSDFHLDPTDIKKGLIKITSCSAGETSRENPEKGHGLFSYALIEGINDKADKDQNGQITITELFDYVSKQVPEYAREMKSEQTPLLLMEEVEGEIVFAYNPAKMEANALKQESQKLFSESRKERLSEKEKESQLQTALEKLAEAEKIWPGGEYDYLKQDIHNELNSLTGVKVKKLTEEAWQLYQSKDYKEALAKINEALEQDSENISNKGIKELIVKAIDEQKPDPKQKAQKLAGEAYTLYESGSYKEALEKINEALEQDSENISNKGIKELIVKAIDEQKPDPKQKAQKLVGEAYTLYESGSYKEALEKINEALEQDSENISNKAIKKLIETAQKTAKEYQNNQGQRFVLIPSGDFMMGDTLTPEEVDKKYPGGKIEWYKDAHPRHKVTISQPFYMGQYEVTVGEFRKFVEDTQYKTTAEKEGTAYGFDKESGEWKSIKGLTWKSPGFEQSARDPVTCVSWFDAQEYIKWLNEQDRARPVGYVYRLPSEAEWEYACRAGSDTDFFWGEDQKDGAGYLNAADESGASNGKKWNISFPFNDGYITTSPVGKFKANAWGLYDMHGNVWEWCNDWYDSDYYTNSPSTDPKGPDSGSYRVIRGGGWNSNARYCRSANRGGNDPEHRDDPLGFRLALSSPH